jgi:hypothetical protein
MKAQTPKKPGGKVLHRQYEGPNSKKNQVEKSFIDSMKAQTPEKPGGIVPHHFKKECIHLNDLRSFRCFYVRLYL